MIKYLCTITILLSLFGLNACKKPVQSSAEKLNTLFRKDGELTITSADGVLKGTFDIEIAETEDTLHQGLKFRERMEANQAMLFIFDGKMPHGFWMQDTYMPLDMLFIDKDGVIFQIEENTIPFSEESIASDGFNKYTLEVIAGTVGRLKIQTGDKISWTRIP